MPPEVTVEFLPRIPSVIYLEVPPEVSKGISSDILLEALQRFLQ